MPGRQMRRTGVFRLSEREMVGGRYRLVRRTGQETSGSARWLAQDEDLGADVVLTELPLVPGEDAAARLRRVRERVEGVRQLGPRARTVGVYDVVEHAGNPWIVSGYHPEATVLASRVAAGAPVPVSEAAGIGLAVLDTLTAGHFLGVTHGRVSPSAILLVPEEPEEGDAAAPPRVLLSDYGLGESGVPTAAEYLAPEQAQDPGAPATPAADLYALGATLYAAVEGRAPFTAGERPVRPAAPERAGELTEIILGMLSGPPGERPSADTVRAALERVAREDERQEEPDGRGDGGAVPPDGTSRPDEAPRRGEFRWREPLKATAAMALAAAVAVGATLMLTTGGNTSEDAKGKGNTAPGHSTRFPYGQLAGLTKPLDAGDCVQAVWPRQPLRGTPNLGVIDCGDGTDAQTVAVMDFPDIKAARAQAAGRCARQAGKTAEGMADAGTYALVPTAEGFAKAGRRAACLVVSRHISFDGEVGDFRETGIDLNLQQMAIGDCWTYEDTAGAYKALLVSSCAESHTDQVVGFVTAPPGMSSGTAQDQGDKLCENTFGRVWVSDDDTAMFGYATGEDAWNKGFRKVICTIGPSDGTPVTTDHQPSQGS
ncbi:septum formation family protein [Streptomyces sp. NPDC059080]|uniref:septum formation family protein n=1 Tax=Streptomyces sp. NPDC059080 TaxID=3346718 RepID=UPI00368E2B1E